MKNRRKLILTLVILLVVGFASVSTSLILNGVIGISSNQDDFYIIFTSAKLNNQKRNDFIDQETKQTINFETDKLTKVDEEAVLDYEVTNTSRLYDGEVEINCIVPDNEYVVVDYQPRSMIVEAGKKDTGRITAKLIKASTEDDNISIKCTLNATAIERDELGEEYVEPFSKSGTLMAVAVDEESGEATDKFWLYRGNITKVVFEDKLISHETSGELIFDVSEAQDGSVMAYLVENGETLTTNKDLFGNELESTTAYTLYIQGETGVKANVNSSFLFSEFVNLLEIENLKYFDTSKVTNMSDMFSVCINLTALDVSNFDTSNVTDMSWMFQFCSSLTTLDVSNFDTSNVTNMTYMFNDCSSLTSLDISSFNTNKVADMSFMFYLCSSLNALDVSNFDTSNVTDMSFMFDLCSSLNALDVSNFDTSNVMNMAYMFNECSSLTTLDLSKFDTSKVTDMSWMFYECSSLTSLDLSDFNTSQVIDMGAMFVNCSSLILLDISNFNTSQVTDMAAMFRGCSSLTTLDVSSFDTSNVKYMGDMFYNCSSLTSLDVSNFKTSQVIDMVCMFQFCSSLTSLDISNFNTSKGTDIRWMFSEMKSDVIVKVKDTDMQNWVLTSDNGRPSSWSTENVIM